MRSVYHKNLGIVMFCLMALSNLAAAQILSPRITESEVEKIIKRAENLTNDLDDDFDDALDDTPLDGTDEKDRLDKQAEALEDTFDEIKSDYKDRASFDTLRDKVHRALTIANDLNRVVVKYRLTKDVERDWNQLRSDLNSLARFFNLPEISNTRPF